MGKIRAKGVVYYPPGPWGPNVPVIGANVKIVDKDAPGRGDDTIWTGTTGSNGGFDGQTQEWHDTVTTRVWVQDSILPPSGHWEDRHIPDPTDVRALVATITKGSCSITLPFPYISDNAPPIPLVLANCQPPPIVIGSVNGTNVLINAQANVYELIKDLAEANTPEIKVRIYGPAATALEPITRPQAQLREWVLQHQGIAPNSLVLMPNPADWVIVACCICVAVVIIALAGPVAVGAGIFLACLGVALVLAVHLGYANIVAKQCTRLDVPTGQIPVGYENCVEITLKES